MKSITNHTQPHLHLVITLLLLTFSFRCSFAADDEPVDKSILERNRNIHMRKFKYSIIPSKKSYHLDQSNRFQYRLNKIDPELIHHEHVITYKGEKVHSVEKKEGFMRKDNPSVLGTTHNFKSIYPSTPKEANSPKRSPTPGRSSSSHNSPIRSPHKGKNLETTARQNSLERDRKGKKVQSPSRSLSPSDRNGRSSSELRSKSLRPKYRTIPLSTSYPNVSPTRPKGKSILLRTREGEPVNVEQPFYFKSHETTRQTPLPVNRPAEKVIHVKAKTGNGVPESAQKAVQKVAGKPKPKK